MSSVGEEILNEIERVSGIRQQYESMRGMPQVNVEPAIYMMTQAINQAKKSVQSDDPADAIRSLQVLKSFDS